jgi:tripartite ATP-independent transporter DctM subunit
MSEKQLIGAAASLVLMVLMFFGMPIWLCMTLVGVVGYVIIGGVGVVTAMGLTALGSVENYTFAVMPVFLLMGELADLSGMMKEAYRSANILLGRLRGGLAMASLVGAAAFSLVSGSSLACSAIMTRIALPQLMEHKYDPGLATGALTAGGTLGNLIPPGFLIVLYCIMTDVSLAKLIVALYVPGFLLLFMYMIQIYIQCTINPALGPAARSFTWKEKLVGSAGMVSVTIVFILTLGGIQFGIFTPNEAASVATVFVFFYALWKRTLTGQNLLAACINTIATTGMGLAILIGAQIFNIFIATSGLPQALVDWLVGLGLSKVSVVVIIMVVYFILGIPLNGTTILLLTLPILLPVLNAYKINLIWFGVLAITQCELASISPPVGMCLFVVAAMGKPFGISMATVFRGAMPFMWTCVLFVVLLIAFPQISLFLVDMMR